MTFVSYPFQQRLRNIRCYINTAFDLVHRQVTCTCRSPCGCYRLTTWRAVCGQSRKASRIAPIARTWPEPAAGRCRQRYNWIHLAWVKTETWHVGWIRDLRKFRLYANINERAPLQSTLAPQNFATCWWCSQPVRNHLQIWKVPEPNRSPATLTQVFRCFTQPF